MRLVTRNDPLANIFADGMKKLERVSAKPTGLTSLSTRRPSAAGDTER
jgi:hypothetical protein